MGSRKSYMVWEDEEPRIWQATEHKCNMKIRTPPGTVTQLVFLNPGR